MDVLERLIASDRQLVFLNELVRNAVASIRPERIYLFGSRALGSHTSRSDVDLYFEIGDVDDAAWSRFAVEQEDELPTLLSLDLVRSDRAAPHIREAVVKKGIIIYERT